MRNLKSIASVLIVFITALGLFSVMDAFSATNVILAVGSVVAGGTVTQQAATGGDNYSETTEYLDMRDVERKVSEYKQWQYPLLTILGMKGKGDPVESWEAKYYAVDARGMSTSVTAATAIVNGVTTITVADATIFTRYNTIYWPLLNSNGTTGTAPGATKVGSGRILMGLVIGFPASNQVTVKLINEKSGGNLANTDLYDSDSSGDTTYVYRGGSAHPETAASTTPWGVIPETDYNYVQLFMEQVEQSEFQKLMKKEADWGFSDLKRMAIEDFKMQLERSILAGIRGSTNVTVDGQTKRFYTMGGILNDTGIPVNSTFDLSDLKTTPNLIVPILKSAFTGNNGSKERWMLMGADFTEAMEQANFTDKQFMAKETDTVMGFKVKKIVSTFGTLNLYYYEHLDLLGKEKSAMIMDPANIFIKDLAGKGFNVRPIDYKSAGIANVEAAVIEQCSTLLVKNKSTHMIINAVA